MAYLYVGLIIVLIGIGLSINGFIFSGQILVLVGAAVIFSGRRKLDKFKK